ncbi:phosphatase 2C-like domain-containing protein [Mycena filopes]|nr:phosphatase 2C-like domain-containing protein [Mycena filopes]
MVFRSAQYFIRWGQKYKPSAVLARPRVRAATRIAIGISTAILLASLNNHIYGDAVDSSPASNDSNRVSLETPFADADDSDSNVRIPTREMGTLPPGIISMYCFAPLGTYFRTVSQGPRTLLNFFEADNVLFPSLTADRLWSVLETFVFPKDEIEHSSSSPQSVELDMQRHPPLELIHGAIKLIITKFDEALLNRIFSSTTKDDGRRATLSACMLSALYEDDVQLLHITSLGNMRAVLGRPRKPDGEGVVKYDVHVLSVDHSPNNPSERARIEKLHPGEDVIQNGTLFGRRYTRALGDRMLKWAPGPDVQQSSPSSHRAAAPDPRIKTPPYISAEPDVNTIKVQPGDFLVMTSHWVSESLTDVEVVRLVGAWLNKRREPRLSTEVPLEGEPPVVINSHELSVHIKEGEDLSRQPPPTLLVAYSALEAGDEETLKALGVAVVFFR